MTTRYNYRGEELCDHVFNRGLCERCLAPETQIEDKALALENTRRALNAVEWMTDYMDNPNNTFGRRLSREDAIFRAWRANARKLPKV